MNDDGRKVKSVFGKKGRMEKERMKYERNRRKMLLPLEVKQVIEPGKEYSDG